MRLFSTHDLAYDPVLMIQLVYPILSSPAVDSETAIVDLLARAEGGLARAEGEAFCANLSAILFSDRRAAAFPELQALAFWLRPASLQGLITQAQYDLASAIRVPAGRVFLIPPRNVPVLLGYGLALSILCGNATCARVPDIKGEVLDILLAAITATLEASSDEVRRRVVIVRYGRDDAVTAALSSVCDVRLVWGGDATVAHIAQIPLPPLARHIGFADRFSSVAVDAAQYLAATEENRATLAKNMANDIYLFDQFACSSPRLILWVGAGDLCQKARVDFYPRLAAAGQSQTQHYGASEAVMKQNAAFVAMYDAAAESYETFGAALSVLRLRDFEGLKILRDESFGFGLLLEVFIENLEDFAPHVVRKDQTLAVWGFETGAIRRLAEATGGRGLARIVAVGAALRFDPLWDGVNLFDVLTKYIFLPPYQKGIPVP